MVCVTASEESQERDGNYDDDRWINLKLDQPEMLKNWHFCKISKKDEFLTSLRESISNFFLMAH